MTDNDNDLAALSPRTGVDLFRVNRIEKAITRHGDRFIKRVFTGAEIEYCSKLSNPFPSYAARFAAKEAVMKLLGEGIGNISFTDVEVVRDASGRPSLRLSGKAEKIAAAMGVSKVDISLSHEKDIAVAVVFAIARGGGRS